MRAFTLHGDEGMEELVRAWFALHANVLYHVERHGPHYQKPPSLWPSGTVFITGLTFLFILCG